MDSEKKEYQTTKYIIQIKNHIDSNWEQWFEGVTISHTDEGMTILTGDVVDQSALYGLLEKIHNLNLTLISFQKIDPE
jgi:hypothetical protein